MSKSLAELRQSSHASLPERTYELCLSQALVAEAQSLVEEKRALEVGRASGDEPAPPRKMSEGKDPRIKEIEARLDELQDEMREHTGELRLRGVTAGEWRRWADAHPAREDGRDEKGRAVTLPFDEAVAYGYCDASALIARLGDFVVSWNGAELQTGDWEWLEEKTPAGDLKAIASIVVRMHEAAGVRPMGKSRSGSSATAPSETA